MAAPANLSFEAPAASPVGGGALGWTLVSTAALDYALFNEVLGYEAFTAGWGNDAYVTAFTLDMLDAAIFGYLGENPLFAEGFERGWGDNENFERDFAGLETLPAEAFEGWTAYDTTLVLAESLDAEDFTWGSYATDLGGDVAYATFSGPAAYSAEGFSDVRPGGAVEVNTVDNLLVLDGHAFLAGERVRFFGAPPPPLQNGVWYFVVTPTAGATFAVALEDGGAAIDLTGVGGGAEVEANPARYWTSVMRTI